jgi:hypothetical protein
MAALNDALATFDTALEEADAAITRMIAALGSSGQLPEVERHLRVAVDTVREADKIFVPLRHSSSGRRWSREAIALYAQAHAAAHAVRRTHRFAGSEAARAAQERILLLTGRAGSGKTHLLCDAAERRTASGAPTVLLLGQDFSSKSLLSQVGELSQLGGTLDEVLGTLDAASEASGCMGLLMIDALNESERPERWRDDVRALVVASSRYPHVALVLSCRTEFVGTVVGDVDMPTVQHAGFAEATGAAIRRFAQAYELELPIFPILNPEFSNPLYLKLACEALATLGATRFPFGAASQATVCYAFIEAVNKRLSEPGRCDYDEQDDLVGRVVSQISLAGTGPVDRAEVRRITDEALPGRPWSRSLMRGLIAEGIIQELEGNRGCIRLPATGRDGPGDHDRGEVSR